MVGAPPSFTKKMNISKLFVRKVTPFVVFFWTGLQFAPFTGYAQETSTVLNTITGTADKICGIVQTSGDAHSREVKGAVNSELNGLASRLVKLGVSGAGDITSSNYQGVIQQQLAETLKDERACKYKVFDTLQSKLLPAQQSTLSEPTSTSNSATPNEPRTATKNIVIGNQTTGEWGIRKLDIRRGRSN